MEHGWLMIFLGAEEKRGLERNAGGSVKTESQVYPLFDAKNIPIKLRYPRGCKRETG